MERERERERGRERRRDKERDGCVDGDGKNVQSKDVLIQKAN